MLDLDKSGVDKIVQSCFNLYSKLPKTGKPIENEWTVLSCVVLCHKSKDNYEVVSLGTGTKCIGASKMSPKGDILNDSHAEVFARRGFLLFLYDNVEKCINGQPSVFIQDNTKFRLKEDIEFAFFSSQLPCGDASIIPKSGDYEQFGVILQSHKRKANESESDSKKLKLDNDIHRTGAKCLPNSEQDPKETGSNYHIVGQVRIKPGRGDRTLSVSCSDKMAKWIHLGIQGSLLQMLCGTIHIRYFIFGANVPYSEESLNRALLRRNEFELDIQIIPEFHQSRLPFSGIRTESRTRPAAGSIVWIKLDSQCLEVAVQGKKLGTTKKTASHPKNSLCISKYNIYKRFNELFIKNEKLREHITGEKDLSVIPYNEMKRKCKTYLNQWIELKEKFFKSWTVKPDMWDFCISLESGR